MVGIVGLGISLEFSPDWLVRPGGQFRRISMIPGTNIKGRRSGGTYRHGETHSYQSAPAGSEDSAWLACWRSRSVSVGGGSPEIKGRLSRGSCIALRSSRVRKLNRTIRANGIRTVLNLRGGNPTESWYQNERRTTLQRWSDLDRLCHGIGHVFISISGQDASPGSG